MSWKSYGFLYVTLVVGVTRLCQLSPGVEGRRPPPPLGAEEVRHMSRPAECQFGKSVRELGSSWFADLGPPFGVMYCIKCECIAVQKKRRVLGKVHCRNLKHECPEPKCDEPVLLPGRCCKSCPPHGIEVELAQDAVQAPPDEDDKNFKYYASVLAGEGQSATARFTFTKKNLYYSLYYSTTSRPQLLQFLDKQGNILEEQELGVGSAYENATEKLCGVWHRLPRDYRKLLREEGLVVSLVWPTSPGAPISGQILRYPELATEELSGLLRGERPEAAGSAIVSISTTTPSVHLVIAFAGLFTGADSLNAPVSVSLHSADGKEVLHEHIKVEKASPELNTVSLSSPVSIHDLRLLVRAKLFITVTSKNSQISISGLVRARVTCEVFEGLLTGERGSSGLITAFIDKNGDFLYKTTFHGVPTPLIITLESSDSKKLEEMSSSGELLERTSPRLVEGLYSGSVTAVTGSSTSSRLSGRLLSRPAPAPRSNLRSLLLTPVNGMVSLANLAAFISIAVDSQCNLYFEVEVSEGSDYCVWLSHVPLVAPGAPETARQVDCGSGSRFEGSLLTLLPSELQLIDSGVITVQLRDNATDSILLAAPWHHKEIPRSCLPESPTGVTAFASDAANGPTVINAPSCYQGGAFHADGAQWRDHRDPCLVCSCSLGTLSCHTQCINKTVDAVAGSGCQMAGQVFPPGSTWHPYLPPNGFDTCTLCTCHADSLKVSCPRTVCPPLQCDERLAYRPDKRSCCKICPSQQVSVPPKETKERVVESADESADILRSGGCEYPVGGPYRNGSEWHPRLYSGGEIKCVLCKCTRGEVKCERKKCTKATCHDECCVAQCNRRRRYAKRKQKQQN